MTILPIPAPIICQLRGEAYAKWSELRKQKQLSWATLVHRRPESKRLKFSGMAFLPTKNCILE